MAYIEPIVPNITDWDSFDHSDSDSKSENTNDQLSDNSNNDSHTNSATETESDTEDENTKTDTDTDTDHENTNSDTDTDTNTEEDNTKTASVTETEEEEEEEEEEKDNPDKIIDYDKIDYIDCLNNFENNYKKIYYDKKLKIILNFMNDIFGKKHKNIKDYQYITTDDLPKYELIVDIHKKNPEYHKNIKIANLVDDTSFRYINRVLHIIRRRYITNNNNNKLKMIPILSMYDN